MRNLLVIIPTLNEQGNIKIIVEKIKKAKKDANILFVDDNSLDDTRLEIKLMKKKYKNIFYLFRDKKKGVGSAHKDGILWGYKKKYNYIFTMDCDGTHDPRDIKKMLKLSNSCDLVNTNRFLLKNALHNWNYYRILITKFRYILVSILLKTKLDSSGGFRLYNRKKINIRDIMLAKDNNYNFFWESLFYLEKKYQIKEIPINLPKRVLGKSKMKFKDLFNGLFYLLIIYIKNI